VADLPPRYSGQASANRRGPCGSECGVDEMNSRVSAFEQEIIATGRLLLAMSETLRSRPEISSGLVTCSGSRGSETVRADAAKAFW